MDPQQLKENVQRVLLELESAAEGRYPTPKLVAVTKTHTAQEILPLAELGLKDIGENRVQEACEKWPALQGKFRLHIIGRLQTNKVKYIIENASMIQSVDRLELAREIDRRASAAGIQMPALIQISPAGEPQKGGMPPEELLVFLREVSHMDALQVRGLMAVMPLSRDETYLSGLFQQMRVLFENARAEAIDGIIMEELSMGMSGDYRLAARYGATMVRVGSAIFGPRG